MAERYRQSRNSPQQGSGEDWPRQSEQFEPDRTHQQNLSQEWNDRSGSQDRQSGAGRSWYERDRVSQSAWSDPASDYTRQPHDGRRPAADGHTQNRGSDQAERGFIDRATDEVATWFGDEKAAQRREQDHRGRGPQGYTRSDARILEDACDRLTEERRVDASGISVSVDKGEVTLAGLIADRTQKRRAEDCVESVSGVTHVQNNLRVGASEEVTGLEKTPPAPLI